MRQQADGEADHAAVAGHAALVDGEEIPERERGGEAHEEVEGGVVEEGVAEAAAEERAADEPEHGVADALGGSWMSLRVARR